MNRKTIGVILKKRRKMLGLTQEQVMVRVGLSRQQIIIIENAQANYRFDTLCKYADGVGGELNISFGSRKQN